MQHIMHNTFVFSGDVEDFIMAYNSKTFKSDVILFLNMSVKDEFLDLVRGKKVILATHWDADGVSSGALVNHLIKDEVAQIKTISKGEVFLITPDDIADLGEYDYVICTDIKPSLRLPHEKVIYFDHHPNENHDMFKLTIFDDTYQSCSLLIYDKLMEFEQSPIAVFCAMLGFFGDGGKIENLPTEVLVIANDLIPEYLEERQSYYNKSTYMVIQSMVSSLNVGKRKDWSGKVCLDFLMNVEHPKMFSVIPEYDKIKKYKEELRVLYNQPVDIKKYNNVDLVMLESPYNIQGVICARHMTHDPIMSINKRGDWHVGSMRVPDAHDLDAGVFLEHISDNIKTFEGGGHEKAGGFRFKPEELDEVLDFISGIDHREMKSNPNRKSSYM